MKYGLNNNGSGKIFYLILTFLFLLLVITCGRPYYRYYAFSWFTDSTLKINAGNEGVIRQKIKDYAVKKGIPLKNESLSVYRYNAKVKVKISWSDEIDLYGYYKKPLTFVIDDMF